MAADIQVALELDDSKYSQGIRRAEAAAKQFGNTVNTSLSGVQGGFNKLSTGLSNINSKFSALSTAIIGVGMVSFANSLMKAADQLTDTAQALDINTARFMEMGVAAQGANSSLEGLTNMIARMQGNLDDAVTGNSKLREAFKQVGIGINEINSLTPDQLFNRIAVSLAGMDDRNKQAALSSELLGKAARIINWKDYVSDIQRVYGSMENYAAAQDKLAEQNRLLEIQTGQLRVQMGRVLSVILEFISPMKSAEDAMSGARIAAVALTSAFALFVGVKIVSGIQAIGTAWKTVSGWLGIATATTVANTGANVSNTAATTVNAAAKRVQTAAQVALASATAAATAAQRAYNIAILSDGPASAAAIAASRALSVARAQQSAATAAAATSQTALNTTVAAGTGIMATASASTAAFVARLGSLATVAAIASGALALFYSKGLNEGEDEEIFKMRQLGDAINRLSKAERERYNQLLPNERELANQQMLQLESIRKQQDVMDKITGKGQPVTGTAVFAETPEQKSARERLANATRSEINSIDSLITSYQRRNEEVQKGLQWAIESYNLAEKEQALSNMSERDKSVKLARLEAEKTYLTQIDSLNDKIRQYSRGTAEEKAQLDLLYKAKEEVTRRYKAHIPVVEELALKYAQLQEARELNLFTIDREIDTENELMRIQHEIATSSMSEIEKKYADIDFAARQSAKSAIEAEQARRGALLDPLEQVKYYEAAMKGTDGLKAKQLELFRISRSFETGWRRAFNTYVDEATNAARQAERIFQKVTQSMEDMMVDFAKTGRFEFRGFLNGIIEDLLRSQIRQLMSQIFNIGGSSSSNILGSVGKLLGFANGGIIPTNRPVLVGERGPELISGAAGRVVTPNDQLGMGSTYVTYNISAVDALSFKQLVASDPGFIYAVTQQGARGIPSTRR